MCLTKQKYQWRNKEPDRNSGCKNEEFTADLKRKKKKTSELEDWSIEIVSLTNRNKKNNFKKWIEPQRPVGHYQEYYISRMGVPQEVREQGAEKNIWRQNDQYLPEFGDSWKHTREASHPMEVVLSKLTADFSSETMEARGRGWHI